MDDTTINDLIENVIQGVFLINRESGVSSLSKTSTHEMLLCLEKLYPFTELEAVSKTYNRLNEEYELLTGKKYVPNKNPIVTENPADFTLW